MRLPTFMLLVLVIIAILAWTHFSVMSPVSGWLTRAFSSASLALHRSSVTVPCPAEPNHRTDVQGLKIAYPACYELQATELEGGQKLLLLSGDGISGVSLSIIPLGEFRRAKDLEGLLDDTTAECSQIPCGTWRAVSCYDATSVKLLTPDKFLAAESVIPEHLLGTELEAHLNEVVAVMVAELCDAGA